MLDSLAAKRILTFEEGYALGGFGSAVAEYYAERGTAVHLTVVGAENVPVAHATVQEQAETLGLSAEALAARIRAIS